jgi:hypothetical protein
MRVPRGGPAPLRRDLLRAAVVMRPRNTFERSLPGDGSGLLAAGREDVPGSTSVQTALGTLAGSVAGPLTGGAASRPPFRHTTG